MRSSRAWLIAALFGVIAVLGFMFFSGGGSKETDQVAELPVANLGSVVVVKQDVEPRTVLTPEMIEVQQVPAEYIHPMAIVSLEKALDMITLVPVNAGEQLLQTKIADPSTNYLSYKLKEGHVAYTVPVSDLTGAAGMIRVGDQVHVLANFPKELAGNDMTDFVLYDTKVISIGQNMAMNAQSESADSFANMTLEVLPEHAMQLAYAQNQGSLQFILKSAFDNLDTEDLEAVTADTFFGESEDYKDVEYLSVMKEIIELRETEEKLLKFGQGDLQRVREDLDYDRFYYDDRNPNDLKNSGANGTGNTNSGSTNGSTETKTDTTQDSVKK